MLTAAHSIDPLARKAGMVIVDGIDGRTHYIDLGGRQATDEPLIRNTIVEVCARDASPRDVDQAVADVAGRNHGV